MGPSRGQRSGWPLLFRSGHSLLRGVGHPEEWVALAAEHGYEMVAQADWANLYAALPFLEAAETRGLAAVLGAEIPYAPLPGVPGAGRLLVFCQDLCGYRNLCALLSLLGDGLPPPVRAPASAAMLSQPLAEYERDGEEVPGGAGLTARAVSREDLINALEAGGDGLIVLSEDEWLLRRLRGAYGEDRLALLLAWPPPRQGVGPLERRAEHLGLAAVALPQASVLDPVEAATLRLLTAIRRRGLWDAVGTAAPRALPVPDAALLRSGEQIYPRALRQGRALLETCRLRYADLRPRTFVFPRVGGRDGAAALRTACEAGLHSRPLAHPRRSRRRLEQELAVIEQLGFVDYFLATAEIARWARERRIPLVGRGSGVSSLAAYLLGLTGVDPVAGGLYFERFLHPLRAHDYPDLDLDIAWNRRDEVVAYALGAFGPERGAMVGTHQFYRPRGALREAGRALGIDDRTLSRAARVIPFGGLGAADDGTGREALERLARDGDAALGRAARLAVTLLGRPRGIGMHPGGLVLAEMALARMVPIERSANGMVITQFDMHGVERIGLIKIDLLGNRVLGTLAEAGAYLEQSGQRMDLDRIAHADPATATLLCAGRTLGCFQLESPAMRTLLRQVRATTLEDVIAALALVRPGPSSSGMKEAYIRRARQAEAPRPLDPALAHVLTRTYHLPLFEEDVMCLAAETGGLSYGEADMLRRAIGEAVRAERRAGQGEPRPGEPGPGKPQPGEPGPGEPGPGKPGPGEPGPGEPRPGEAGRGEMGAGGHCGEAVRETPRRVALRRGFLAAAGRFGREAAARRVWDELVRFASYSFCKAHAAGFGVLAYQSAYLKANHPGPFFAALLNHHQGMYPARVHLEEARRHGLQPVPPCVQRGGIGWTWEADGRRLRCGLGRVRHLQQKTRDRLLEARTRGPFRDLAEFVTRVRPDAQELEALLLAGCFDDCLGAPRGELVWQMHRLLRVRRGPAGATALGRGAGQVTLALMPEPGSGGGRKAAAGRPAAPGAGAGPWREISAVHRARLERQFLGISLALHPLALVPGGMPGGASRLTVAAAARRGHGRVELTGIVAATRGFTARNGAPMLFFSLEDETGMIEGTLGGEIAADRRRRPRVDDYLRVEGRLERRYSACGLRASEARILGRHE